MSELSFEHYGEERERIATEDELKIFDVVKELASREDLRLVRKSDNYVSAVIGDWDLARFKYSPRAKWIMFPCVDRGSIKRRIESAEDVRDFAEEIKMSLDHIEHYSNG